MKVLYKEQISINKDTSRGVGTPTGTNTYEEYQQ
jgi:hypothetical protein